MIRWLNAGRVLGLLLVLVYHFFSDFLPGGFLGVDVFFTFSGYLITALAIEEYRKSGRFKIGSFCKRRFLRIWPAILLTVVLTLPFALLISPDFTAGIGQQIAAALGGVTNYFEILNGGSYEAQMLPHLFLHTWSLAAELQFYVFWGLFCWFTVLILRKLMPTATVKSFAILKIFLFAVALLTAVISYCQMQVGYSANIADPSVAYFGLVTRGFPFMLGAAAGALFNIQVKERSGSSRERTIFAGGMALSALVLFLMALILNFADAFVYRAGFLIASLCTVAIILCARQLHAVTKGTTEPRALTVAAKLSYGIFLFHWPLYVVFNRGLSWGAWPSAFISLSLSLIFTSLLCYAIEPLLHKKASISVKKMIPALAVFLIVTTILSVVTVFRAPQISVLENELLTGYLYQDADAIGAKNRLTSEVRSNPLALPEAMPVIGNLGKGIADPFASEEEQPVMPIVPVPIRRPSDVLNENTSGIPAGVSIVGDSVAMGSRNKLIESIPNCEVDADGSRNMSAGYDILMDWQTAGTLREYVVVALGTNKCDDVFEKIEMIIQNLAPGHRIIFVTPFDGRATPEWASYETMEYIRKLPPQHDFVTVADWAAVIKPREELLGTDQVHIGGNSEAIQMYVNCVIEAINEAAEKPTT